MIAKRTANSPARKLLVEILSKSEISGEEDPTTVWESKPLFQKLKPSNFRTQYNSLRRDLPSADLSRLGVRCTAVNKKRNRLDCEDPFKDVSDTSERRCTVLVLRLHK
eukprot:IDg14370t1